MVITESALCVEPCQVPTESTESTFFEAAAGYSCNGVVGDNIETGSEDNNSGVDE
jgi:hypothetical protein